MASLNDGNCQPLSEVVFLHVIAEGPKAHTQEFRGSDLDSAGPLQGLCQVTALDLFHVRLEVKAGIRQIDGLGRRARRSGNATAADRWRETLDQDGGGRFERHRAFEDVFKLADIALPVV